MRRVLIAAGAAIALAGCGGSSSGGGSAQVQPTSPSPALTAGSGGAAGNANGCTPPPALQKSPQSYRSEPPLTTAKTTYTATITTNCGTIVVALDGKDAPHTVNSFAFLAGKGYFDDTPCHRLTTSGIFVLQCGDPTGTGSGGPGYTIPDENLGAGRVVDYPRGTIAMANAGPNTGGSQFFLVYKDTKLPPAYTPFGRITKGLDVLTRVAAAGSDDSNGPGDGHPKQPVVIESFTVAKG